MARLDSVELGRLRMSVGYGTHKRGRPLSPVEVGTILRRLIDDGCTLRGCAELVGLKGTGHIGRFLKILRLPQEIQHLIDWGASPDTIGFTVAVELTRLNDTVEQDIVAQSILKDRLTSKEVRQIGQLRTRTRRTLDKCIAEVLGMRTTIERRYVLIGSIGDPGVEDALGHLSQMERDSILVSVTTQVGLQGATGRLGSKYFTLVGDEEFNVSMNCIGKESIETQVRAHISEIIRND